ncbi:MAG: hypothetical protein N3E36_02615 [Sulfolobales archaeon]|nr:hypothetical protein [Sulfolobales archaeon]MCX8198908.1 hypothetical protein [Sulfolobales archaeon]MDW8169886.1 hypothetical protein [Desulfurococcaceae archaeon]
MELAKLLSDVVFYSYVMLKGELVDSFASSGFEEAFRRIKDAFNKGIYLASIKFDEVLVKALIVDGNIVGLAEVREGRPIEVGELSRLSASKTLFTSLYRVPEEAIETHRVLKEVVKSIREKEGVVPAIPPPTKDVGGFIKDFLNSINISVREVMFNESTDLIQISVRSVERDIEHKLLLWLITYALTERKLNELFTKNIEIHLESPRGKTHYSLLSELDKASAIINGAITVKFANTTIDKQKISINPATGEVRAEYTLRSSEQVSRELIERSAKEVSTTISKILGAKVHLKISIGKISVDVRT